MDLETLHSALEQQARHGMPRGQASSFSTAGVAQAHGLSAGAAGPELLAEVIPLCLTFHLPWNAGWKAWHAAAFRALPSPLGFALRGAVRGWSSPMSGHQ